MSIESEVIGFLSRRLNDVPVSSKVPHGPPSAYVVVERTGGGDEKDGMERVTLAIRSVAPSLSLAIELSAQVREVMRRLPELPRVFRCTCQREYDYTDTRSKERRYQAIFDILYMEETEI